MKSKLLGILVSLMLCVGVFTSCEAFFGASEKFGLDNYAVTVKENVKEEYQDDVTSLEAMAKFLPEQYKAKAQSLLGESELVFVKKTWVKEGEPALKVPDPEAPNDFWADLVDLGLNVGGVFFPPLLAFEGIGALLFKRKRDHWKEALKQALPYDGKVNLKGAVVSVGRSVGMAHSSKDTKTIFEKGKEIADEDVVIINE